MQKALLVLIKLKTLVIGKDMRIEKLLPTLTLFISISSVLAWCSLPIDNTFIWWLVYTAMLLIYYVIGRNERHNIAVVNLFLCIVLSSVIYALVDRVENYWDYKSLYSNLMVFMLPLAAYAYAKPCLLPKTLRLYIRFSLWLLVALWPFLESDAFGRFLVPYSFMALFLSELNKKNKLLIFIALLVTLIYGKESRSDVLKFTVCAFFGICFYFERVERLLFRLIKICRYILLLAPFVFLVLAVTGIFNILQIDEELGYNGKYTLGKNERGDDVSALQDTRTFLYLEEIQSAMSQNYWLQGNSLARGYRSLYFGDESDRAMGLSRGERQSCEVSILNVFNYFGVIGCVAYFCVFFAASYKAIYKSRNRYVPVIGLYVAFRWSFAWIEDFSKFDLNYLFLWIMIGICFSPLYRNMTNEDFKKWVRSIG